MEKIEELANAKVKENIPVTIKEFDRGTAEQKYGFRIYQGGVVPVKSVRIVSIEDFDVEACGGTHVKSTKDVDLIKITRTKRIQDGVVRLEFVAGDSAQEYVKQHVIDVEKQLAGIAAKDERDKLRTQNKEKAREKIPAILEQVSQTSDGKIDEIEFWNEDESKFDEVPVVEVQPRFPGGDSARIRFIRTKTIYPNSARKKGISGMVYINFIVEKDGSTSHARVLKAPHKSLGEEGLRVVNSMPIWTPGKQHNRLVRVSFNMPIKFALE